MARTLEIDRLHPDRTVLSQAAEVVRGGGIIVYPAETIYGIGTGAFEQAAVKRLHALKRRTEPKPLILLVGGPEEIPPLVREVPAPARVLMDAFWPGPVTLLFPAAPGLPEDLTQGRGTIGIRIPSSELCLQLIALCGVPLTSTSANLAGEAPLRSIEEMLSLFPPGIDLYLDAGELPMSLPSTVVDVSGATPRIIREGAIPKEEILRTLSGT
jgi:L-threonylcarbamoyladenylate synthase